MLFCAEKVNIVLGMPNSNVVLSRVEKKNEIDIVRVSSGSEHKRDLHFTL